MRFSLAAASVLVSLLALTACAAGGDPLSSTDAAGPAAARPATTFPALHRPTRTVPLVLSQQAQLKQQAIAQIADVVGQASQQAYAAALAGQNQDVQAAEDAAVALANAAQAVQAQAQDIQQAGGCGQDTPGVTQSDVDNAVSDAANAASAANEITDALNPAPTQSCSQVCGCEGCSQQCTEQPGTVDQNQLDQGVNDANNAGAALGQAGSTLQIG